MAQTGQTQPAAATGAIEGTVLADGANGIAEVLVVLEPTGQTTSTNHNGVFLFPDLPPGKYSVIFSIGDLESRLTGVVVGFRETSRLTRRLPDDFTFVASTTVVAASKTPERIIDAPGAVTRVGADTINLEGGAGQIPALLQFTPGVEYTQSGLYDINFNARGFNNLLSRRVMTLVDGRDTSAPESSVQEWYSMGFLAADLDSIELLRGPSASLYGANTVNGVMTLKTKAPRDVLGGRARFTVGSLDTAMFDARWATALGRGWFMKVVGNDTHSDSFTQSRVTSVEYPGLPRDAVAPSPGGIDAQSGIVRFDRYLQSGALIVTEGGASKGGGETFVTQAGRPQIDDARRQWVRGQYASPWWDFSGEFNRRQADQTALSAGVPLYTNSTRGRLMAQGWRYLDQTRLRFVFGGSYQHERVDSADPQGRQTLYLQPVSADHGGAFGQVDYIVSDRVKVVGGLRWDDASIHPAQWSPRVAAVFSLPRDHSVRVAFNRGFQVGTYTELYLQIPAAPPVDLSPLEAAFAPLLGTTSLGFNVVPVFAIGNPSLDVEKVQSFEVGYTGVFGARGRVGVEFFHNSMRDFISDLLFGINPDYPAYQAPASLPAPVRAAIEQVANSAVPGLTNRTDGGPQIVLSNANTGRVHSRGLEFSAAYRPVAPLWIDATYTWFDFSIKDKRPGAEPQPNAPPHRFAAGATYTHARGAASVHYRWVDDFPWASGIYAGPVPSYGVTDVNGMVKLSRHWEIGANVSNLFDRKHYEMFGGDVLGRRALIHPTLSW